MWMPNQLQSLSMLDKYFKPYTFRCTKVEIEAEKAVDNSPRKEVKPAPEAKAEEPKAEENPLKHQLHNRQLNPNNKDR